MNNRERPAIRVTAEIATAAIGIALVGCAVGATQPWLDRHFLGSFLLTRNWYVFIETTVRVGIGAFGASLAVPLRRRIALAVERTPTYPLTIAIAAALAVGASEWVLRAAEQRPTGWLWAAREPLRRPDDRLGWVLVPNRTAHDTIAGRVVEYTIDAAGCRLRRLDAPVDPDRPTIVFAGESVMFGEGLSWSESIPAQVEARLGIQSANLAVNGYSSDQVHMRLERELPRFRRPAAVVVLFMTALFGRNLDHDRPHFAPGLVWTPAQPASRLKLLARFLVPYRSERAVDVGVAVTHEVFSATVTLASSRHARPLVVVPQFGPEDPASRSIRLRILDDSIPQLVVPLDAGWRLSWNQHPDARAAAAIARAVAERLRQP